jgi:hypothetical protein
MDETQSRNNLGHAEFQKESITVGLSRSVRIINTWLASQTTSRKSKLLKLSEINDVTSILHRLTTVHMALEATQQPNCDRQLLTRCLAAAYQLPPNPNAAKKPRSGSAP